MQTKTVKSVERRDGEYGPWAKVAWTDGKFDNIGNKLLQSKGGLLNAGAVLSVILAQNQQGKTYVKDLVPATAETQGNGGFKPGRSVDDNKFILVETAMKSASEIVAALVSTGVLTNQNVVAEFQSVIRGALAVAGEFLPSANLPKSEEPPAEESNGNHVEDPGYVQQ